MIESMKIRLRTEFYEECIFLEVSANFLQFHNEKSIPKFLATLREFRKIENHNVWFKSILIWLKWKLQRLET